MNKGNQKLYLPVKNKTNYSTNCKIKLQQGAKAGNKAMETKTKKYVEGKGKKEKKERIDIQS